MYLQERQREGRLSEWLAAAGVETLCSVATEYGELLVEKQPHLSVRQGRLLPEEMEQLLANGGKTAGAGCDASLRRGCVGEH